MKNRFLEMDAYLMNASKTRQKNHNSPFSSPKLMSSSKTYRGPFANHSRTFSVQQTALVILIENRGVDLGIPELVDKILSNVPMASAIPDAVRGQMIKLLREKIKSFTDNLIETAELTLNRYTSAAPDIFNSVIVLRNSTASYQDLKSTLIKLSGENTIIDLLILTHGGPNSIDVDGDIDGQKIRDIKAENGSPLKIRSVYMMNCVGSSLNQAWLDAGAKVSCGSLVINYLPEPTTFFFWRNWKAGQSFGTAATGAYNQTVSVMNGAVKAVLNLLPFGSSVAGAFDFHNFDFVKQSAPQVEGMATVTINSKDLSFSQTQSVNHLATTVLPVRLLRSRQFANALENKVPQNMIASKQAIDMIKKFEVFKQNKYTDSTGNCSIGYGTILHAGGCNDKDSSELTYMNGISEQQATELLIAKLAAAQKTVSDLVKIELNQNQFDAIVSFVHNISSEAFASSTLLRLLNEGNYAAVPDEMRKWIHGKIQNNKVIIPELVKRRDTEAALFAGITVAQSLSFPNLSYPFYDTGEHAILGEFINDAISGPLANVYPLLPTTTYQIGKIGSTVPFTYGEIITMGDFYSDYSQLNSASADELNRLKALITRSENHYKNTILGIGGAVSGDIDWGGPGGIGSRYLDLALLNHSHFAPPPPGVSTKTQNNRQSWEYYHRMAIQTARAGASSDALDAAYPINAFGDHFLTDAFSAGHLINKELVINLFIKNVLTNGEVNSAGDKMFARMADKALAIPEIKEKLGKFEKSSAWYEPNWNLDDTGFFLPEVFHRLLKKVMEEPKQGTQKIASLAVKAVHDFLNSYKYKDEKGVPVRSNNGKITWKLTGDGTLNLDNIKIIQLAVKQSVQNLEDAVRNPGTPLSSYYQKVWDYVPNPADTRTAGIVNDAIATFTNPSSDQLVQKAVSLIGSELDTLLDELLSGNYIQCIQKTGAKTVSECLSYKAPPPAVPSASGGTVIIGPGAESMVSPSQYPGKRIVYQ